MLFHRDIIIPKNLKLPTGTIQLIYTHHAKAAAQSDRHGTLLLPAYLDTSKATVVEVEADSSLKVIKVLYRVKLDEKKDLCLAVKNNGVVKTVWANLKVDTHKSLDRKKYVGG